MSTLQFSLFDDEPMIEVTPKGRRAARRLAAAQGDGLTPSPPTGPDATPCPSTTSSTPAAGRERASTDRARTTSTTPVSRPAGPAVASRPEVPLGPEAHVAVSRIAPLQPVVRIAVLELLAVAAAQEAAAQRALLASGSAYPYTVQLNAEMIRAGVQGILNSTVVQQAIGLNALLAAVPDEPIPEPSPEYLAYLAAEETRTAAQARQPAVSAATHASTPQTSQQPADQWGVAGSVLAWPEQTPSYAKPFKDGKTPPCTPLVLLVGSRQRPYELPRLALAAVQYATQVQIRVRFFDAAGTARSIMQEGCYCVPTPEHLARIVERYTEFQNTLTHLADVLSTIGTYAQRLREACGMTDGTTAPTPAQLARLAKASGGRERLCDTVIMAPEPEKRLFPGADPFRIPAVSRGPIARHTPRCYQRERDSAAVSQADTFPCASDAVWTTVATAVQAAEVARTAWLALLAELGTYAAAAKDRRYTPLLGSAPAGRTTATGSLFAIVDGAPDQAGTVVRDAQAEPADRFDITELAADDHHPPD